MRPDFTRFDVAFAALPHGVSTDVVNNFIVAGKRVVDLSADFRLCDAALYARRYGVHKAPGIFRYAVYGLTELHRNWHSQSARRCGSQLISDRSDLGFGSRSYVVNAIRGYPEAEGLRKTALVP